MGDKQAFANHQYTELYEVTGRYSDGQTFKFFGNAMSPDSAMKKVLRDMGERMHRVEMINAETV